VESRRKLRGAGLCSRTRLVLSALAALQFLPNISLIPGGVTIKVGDEVVGAIGVAGGPGGNYDENCARAGLDKIKDRLK
jgi:uncharacterized protein GlcG (DUF336 family)